MTLLPQIEGIIAEGFGHGGRFGERHFKDYAEQLLKNEDKWSSDKAAENFLFNVILISFEHGKELGSPLSRHAILHGSRLWNKS